MASLKVGLVIEVEGEEPGIDVLREQTAALMRDWSYDAEDIDESLMADFSALLGDLRQLLNRARARRSR